MPNQPSPEQDFQNVGQRLALLLVAADLPDDVKEAVASLVPEMNLAQMDKLAGILERSVADGSRAELDAFRVSLEKIKRTFDAQEQTAKQKAEEGLEAIKNQIP